MAPTLYDVPLEAKLMLSVEISIDSLESALAAEAGGAQRVELCSALREGGLTPSLGLIREVRRRISLPVFVLIRPRSGDFLYSEDEIAIMREDIRVARREGIDGVVLGVLTQTAEIDVERTRALIDFAHPMKATFHRAFDMTRNMNEALEAVIRCGADRVLTSGGASTALEGATTLRALVCRSAGRITVLAGGGVRRENIAALAQTTGATEFHSSLRRNRQSAMQHQSRTVHLGEANVDDYSHIVVLEEDVRELVRTANAVLHTSAASSTIG